MITIPTRTIGDDTIDALGMGTWQLTGPDCERAVPAAIEMGYRHIDTAQMYGNETRVGAGIVASGVDRDELWLTTKVDNDNHEPDDAVRTVEQSLRDLGTDRVDLLLVHWPMDEGPRLRLFGAMVELADRELTRYLGVSNFTSAQLSDAQERMPVHNLQVEHHLYLGQDELLDHCGRDGIVFTAYSPLARGKVFDDPVVAEVAEEIGTGPGQVAIAALLADERIVTVPKATSDEHLATNLEAAEVTLRDDQRQRLADLERGERIINPPFGPWHDAA